MCGTPSTACWSATARPGKPDLTFLTRPGPVPVVGVILIDPQPEYGERDIARVRQRRDRAALVARRGRAAVPIDTRLDTTRPACARQSEDEVADRAHGRRPDDAPARHRPGAQERRAGARRRPGRGGGKIRRQAATVGWPCVLPVETLTEEALQDAFDYCLSPAARAKARACAALAREQIEAVRAEFIAALAGG